MGMQGNEVDRKTNYFLNKKPSSIQLSRIQLRLEAEGAANWLFCCKTLPSSPLTLGLTMVMAEGGLCPIRAGHTSIYSWIWRILDELQQELPHQLRGEKKTPNTSQGIMINSFPSFHAIILPLIIHILWVALFLFGKRCQREWEGAVNMCRSFGEVF